jgi:hypothetical protein
MKQRSYGCWIPIDTSIYLEGKTIKAIVDLKFNPGEGVAHILSASKGLSIMSCWGRTNAKTEHIHKEKKPLLQQRIHVNLMSCSGCPKELHGPQQITFGN